MNEETLKKIHKLSSKHRQELQNSDSCFCFYCFKNFDYSDIVEWIESNECAICPKCGIDSVLPNIEKQYNLPMSDILEDMNHYFFQHYSIPFEKGKLTKDPQHYCDLSYCKFGLPTRDK
jgi:hypothetical protein